MTRGQGRRLRSSVSGVILLSLLLCAGCSQSNPFGGGKGRVKIKSIPVRLVFTAVKVSLDLFLGEENALGISPKELMGSALADTEAGSGLPPGDISCLMVVKGREVRYWKLTDSVSKITLNAKNVRGDVKLEVKNEKPLRIELWLPDDVSELEAKIELKD